MSIMLTTSFPPVRQDHREIQLSESVAHEWLTVAYGEEEAAEAMRLPVALRNELYGDALLYGPAAEQIQFFFNALIANLKAPGFGVIGSVMDSAAHQEITWDPLYHRITKWVRHENLFSVHNRFSHLWSEHIRSSVSLAAFKSVCWMLNGQHMFDKPAASSVLLYRADVNFVLETLGMDELGGVFA